MDITKEMLLKMLDEIREYVETNSNSDGTFNFDEGRAWVALDFVKKEIRAEKKKYVLQKRQQLRKKNLIMKN